MEITISVGSDSNNKIRLQKSGISDHHANLIYAPGYLMMVEDLGEGMGTYVNNRRIQGKKILHPNDILCFGEHVFPFEEHYPEMLTRQTSSNAQLDSGEDDGEPDELKAENDTKQEETLAGLRGVKRWINSLQFPKNRQAMHRIWYLVLSCIMLLSLVLPWVSWGNPSEFSLVENDKFDPISGVSMFLDLLKVGISGASLLYILLYGVVILILIGCVIVMICYFLFGINAWKPKSSLVVRILSQVMLVLYGVNFLLQFMRYVWLWMDGENATTQSVWGLTSKVSESRVYIENMGLGYWLCGFAILLAFKATRNGLWRPNFQRKWATLSFTFWLPFLLIIAMVHTNIGIVETSIDKEEYNKQFGGTGFSPLTDSGELKERHCQNAPNLANASYTILIRQFKRDSDEDNRLRQMDKKFDDYLKKLRFYHSGLWIMLHGLFVVSLIQMFRKRIDGIFTLILSLSLVVFTCGLFAILYSLLDANTEFNKSASFVNSFVGIGSYVGILVTLGMVAEQFFFWTNKSDRREKRENLQPLDTLE